MFVNVLKQIIEKLAGQYLSGIDSKKLNLGIWSGDVKIQNVQLNPNFITQLDLPIRLAYSQINILEFQVPWKNLGSCPVNVSLDGLYLILSPLDQKDWVFKDFKGFEARKQLIQQYAKDCIFKVLKQAASELEKKKQQNRGYLENLTIQIMDNLVIHIKNIHVRFEDDGIFESPFSFGVTMNQFDIMTVDQEGREIFVDRTVQGNSEKSIRKIIQLSNMGVYWKSNSGNYFHQKKESSLIISKLQNIILDNDDREKQLEQFQYMIFLNIDATLEQNEKGQAYQKPEVSFDINLNTISFLLRKEQLQDIVQLLEFFNAYLLQVREERKVNQELILGQREKLKASFIQGFRKINPQNKTVLKMAENEAKEYQEAAVTLEIDEIQEMILNEILENEKQHQIQQLEDQKKNENQGGRLSRIWGFFDLRKDNSSSESFISEEESQEIENYVSQNFSEEALSKTQSNRPPDYVWLSLSFQLQEGSVTLINNQQTGNITQVTKIAFHVFAGSVNLRDGGSEIKLTLDSTNLDMIELNAGKHVFTQGIIQPQIYDQNKKYFEFYIQDHPLVDTNFDTIIIAHVGSLRIDVDQQFIKRFIKFFQVQIEDEEFKSITWDRVESQIEKTKKNLKTQIVKQITLKLDIYVESPLISVPFDSQNPISELWVFNLGDLSIKSGNIIQSNQDDQNERDYPFDRYEINIQNICFSYFKNEKVLLNRLKAENQKFRVTQNSINQYYILSDISPQVEILTKRQIYSNETVQQPNITVSCVVPDVDIKICQEIYGQLLKIDEYYQIQEELLEDLDEPPLNKFQLIKQYKQKKIGILWMLNADNRFGKYNALLCGDYIYFFSHPTDKFADFYLYIRNSTITQVNLEHSNIQNCFRIQNKYTDTYLASDVEANLESWIAEISAVRTHKVLEEDKIIEKQFEENNLLEVSSEKEIEETTKSYDQNQIASFTSALFNFQVNTFSLKIQDRSPELETYKYWLYFNTKNLQTKYQQQPFGFDLMISLKALYIEDTIYHHVDFSLNRFITSDNEDLQIKKLDRNKKIERNLIEISVSSKNPNHPNYEKQNTQVDLRLQELFINLKPDFLIQLLGFMNYRPPEISKNQMSSTQIDLKNNRSLLQVSKFARKSQYSIESTNEKDPANKKDSENLQTIQFKRVFLVPCDTIQMEMKANIKRVSIKFVHRKLHLSIAEFRITNFSFCLQSYEDQTKISGKLANIQVFDLTNYPWTIYDEHAGNEQKRTQLIGVIPDSKDAMMEFEITTYPPESKQINENNVTVIFNLNISSVQVVFLMQPAKRILDFILVQALGPFSDREDFTEETILQQHLPLNFLLTPLAFMKSNSFGSNTNQDVQQQPSPFKKVSNRFRDATKKLQGVRKLRNPYSYLEKMGKEQVEQQLNNPVCMQINIKFNHPIIYLKPNPGSDEYVELNLGKIQIVNERRLLENRIISDQGCGINAALDQSLLIRMKNCQVNLINQEQNGQIKREKLTNIFDFSIKFSTLGYSDYYQFLYGQKLVLDKRWRFSCLLSPVVWKLSNKVYCTFMRVFYHNISFNDGCDRFMYHDFWNYYQQTLIHLERSNYHNKSDHIYNSKQVEKLQETIYKYENPLSKVGITATFDTNSLTYFLADQGDTVPFVRLGFRQSRINVEIYNSQTSFEFLGTVFDGNFIDRAADGKIKVSNLLGSIESKDEFYDESQLTDVQGLVETFQILEVQKNLVINGSDLEWEKQNFTTKNFPVRGICEFEALYIIYPNWSRDQSLIIRNMNLTLQLKPLYLIYWFTAVDNSVYAPLPVVTLLQIYDHTIFINNFYSLKILHFSILTPAVSQIQSMLAMEGDLNVSMSYFPPRSVEEVLNDKNLSKSDKNENNDMKLGSKLKVSLRNLEVFTFSLENKVENQHHHHHHHHHHPPIINNSKSQNQNSNQYKSFKEIYLFRQMLLPLSAIIDVSYYVTLTSDKLDFRNVTQIDVTIQQSVFRLSIMDIELLEQTLNSLQAQFPKKQSEDIEKEEIEQKKKEEQRLQLIEQEQELLLKELQSDHSSSMISDASGHSNIDYVRHLDQEELQHRIISKELQNKPEKEHVQIKIQLSIEGLKIILINDVGEAYAPLLQFNMSETMMNIEKNEILLHFAMIQKISLNYYNPMVSRWEPIIQPVGFNIDLMQSKISNIRSVFYMEINEHYESFSIILSTQTIKIFNSIKQIYQNFSENQVEIKIDIDQQKKQVQEESVSEISSISRSSISQFGDQADVSEISPYTIINNTGYTIEVYQTPIDLNYNLDITHHHHQHHNSAGRSSSNQIFLEVQLKRHAESKFNQTEDLNRIKISNSEQECYPIKPKLNRIFASESSVFLPSENNQVTVHVHTRKHQTLPIGEISLDRMKAGCQNIAADQKQDKVFLTHTLQLDVANNRKILVLSSPIVFLNKTKKDFIIHLIDDSIRYDKFVKLKPEKQRPVPLDIHNPKLFLMFKQNQTHVSKEIQLEQILQQREKKGFFEVKLGDQFVELGIATDPDNRQKTVIELHAPYTFKNCFPQHMSFQILSRLRQTSVSQDVKVGETFQEFDHSLQNLHQTQCFLRVNLPGFFWSDEIPLHRPEITQQHQKQFKSKNHQRQHLHYSMNDINGRLSKFKIFETSSSNTVIAGRLLIFYCQAFLVNDSPFDFVIFTNDVQNKNDQHIVSGQSPIEIDDEDKHDHFNVVIFGDETLGENDQTENNNFLQLLSLAEKSTPDLISMSSSIQTIGLTEIDVPIQTNSKQSRLLPISALVSLQHLDFTHHLFSKQIIISPKLIIFNHTGTNMEFRQKGMHNQTYTLTDNQRLPLVWSGESHEKLIEVRILDEGKDWMWSREMDISGVGQLNFWVSKDMKNIELNTSTHFQIENYLFLKVDVVEDEGGQLFIVFTKVPLNQIPYKIQNQSQNLQIFFPTIPALLDYNEILYFSWDFPSEKDKQILAHMDHMNSQCTSINLAIQPHQLGNGIKFQLVSKTQKQICQKSKKEVFKKFYFKYVISLDQFTQVITFYDSHQNEPVTLEEIQRSISVKEMAQQKQKRQKQLKQDALNELKEEIKVADTIIKTEPSEQNSHQIISQLVKLQIKKFGISLVTNSNRHARSSEFLYMECRNIEFGIENQDQQKSTQLRIQYINMDHNSTYILPNPVIFTPQQYQLYNNNLKDDEVEELKNSQSEQKGYFINFLIQQNLITENIILYQSLIFQIDPISLQIDQQFIESAIAFNTLLQQAVNESTEHKDILNLYDSDEQENQQEEEKEIKKPQDQLGNEMHNTYVSQLIDKADLKGLNDLNISISNTFLQSSQIKHSYMWLQKQVPPAQIPTYINQFIISPIDLNLTFHMKPNSKEEEQVGTSIILKTILNILGVVIANVEDAPISLAGIQLENCFDSTNGISNQMVSKYQKEMIFQVFQVLGSLNIIGAPVCLFQNIATGVSDLYQKPRQGFVQGPLEGTLGIVKGAGSLVQHTISGAFNSINQITGSVSSGLAFLCMDDEYIEMRDQLNAQKAQHIGQGLKQGAISIYKGFEKGITGVFLKPYQGAKQDGFIGFMKGTWQGISGLVIKPVTGVLDAVGKTADGIKNTVCYFDDKANENRLRPPRIFYGTEMYMKENIPLDSQIQLALQLIKKGKFKDDYFYASNMIIQGDVKFCIVFTINAIIYLCFKVEQAHQPIWIIEYEEIQKIENHNIGLQLFLKKQNKYLKQINPDFAQVALIPQPDMNIKQHLFELIFNISKENREMKMSQNH